MKINLINEDLASTEDVLMVLEKQKSGTEWATKSNNWAKELAQKFSNLNNGSWVRGLLPPEHLREVLLPKHAHKDDNGDAPFVIPENTFCYQALEIFKRRTYRDNSECLNLIGYLKDQIKTNGFTDGIVLGIKDDKLCHIDGLHRMIALNLLLDEGMEYKPIPVYLSKPKT